MSHPVDHIQSYLNLPPDIEQELRQRTRRRPFKRGETISSLGNMRSNAFFIHKGSARVFYLRDGKEYTFSFSFEDEFIALPKFLLEKPDTITTIEFLEPSQVYVIPYIKDYESIKEMTRKNIVDIAVFITTLLIEHTNRLEERLLLFQNASASDRFKWLIKRYPKILERASITQIASFLGVTKETLYRIRSNKYSPLATTTK